MQSYEANLDGKTIKYRAGTTIEEFLAETSSRLQASAPATQTLPLLLREWKFTKCARRISVVSLQARSRPRAPSLGRRLARKVPRR